MALTPEQEQVKSQAVAAEKRRFLQSQMTLASQLTNSLGSIDQSLAHWASRGYSKNLSDNDLLEFPFTREQLIAFVVVLSSLRENAITDNWVAAVSPIAKVG